MHGTKASTPATTGAANNMSALFIVGFMAVLYALFHGLFDDSDEQGDDKDYWS